MRTVLCTLAAASLVACSGPPNRPLPMVKADAPVVQLNPDRWHDTANDLTQWPGDGTPHPMSSPTLLHNQGPSL